MFIELRHLRSLQAVADEGSLAAAAQVLHLTQSALSHQIKALERYFEVPLFLRNSRPITLTSAGRSLVALAKRVLPDVQSAEAELKRVADGEAGRLHIAIECHACYDWLMPVLREFRSRWPAVEVDIRPGLSFDAMPALQRGEVDLVISSDPVDLPDLAFEPLFEYQAQLVLPRGHTLARRRHILPKHLATETLISYPVERRRLDVFRRFLGPAGVEPAQCRQVELTSVILMLVASGRGVAVLPDWVLTDSHQAEDLVARPLSRAGLKGVLHAACRRQDRERPYMQDVIALARAHRQDS